MTDDNGTISTDPTPELIVEVNRVVFLCPVTFEKKVGFRTMDDVKAMMKELNEMAGKPDEPIPEYIAVA